MASLIEQRPGESWGDPYTRFALFRDAMLPPNLREVLRAFSSLYMDKIGQWEIDPDALLRIEEMSHLPDDELVFELRERCGLETTLALYFAIESWREALPPEPDPDEIPHALGATAARAATLFRQKLRSRSGR